MSKKILIIDDEPVLLDLVCESLEAYSDDIYRANSLATSKVQLAKFKFDCIILDINLGDDNGAQVVKHIKDDDPNGNSKTPIIIMSGYIDGNFSEKFKSSFQGFLLKPFQLEEVEEQVKIAIDKEVGPLPKFGQEDGTSNLKELISYYFHHFQVTDNAFKPFVDFPFKHENFFNEVSSILCKIELDEKMAELFKRTYNAPDKFHRYQISLLINISWTLIKGLGQSSVANLAKIIFASYLHDLSIAENDELARFQQRLDFENCSQLTEEMKHLISTHPHISVDLLKPLPDLPDEVLDIIKFHHARPDGSGFPVQSTDKEVPLIAAVFIVAQMYATFILRSKGKIVHKQFINRYRKTLQTGSFRKVFAVLEKALA
jgi:response regulator RpfG family c-di-GMP phosphodiesterase